MAFWEAHYYYYYYYYYYSGYKLPDSYERKLPNLLLSENVRMLVDGSNDLQGHLLWNWTFSAHWDRSNRYNVAYLAVAVLTYKVKSKAIPLTGHGGL
jgi:hypothetical protein